MSAHRRAGKAKRWGRGWLILMLSAFAVPASTRANAHVDDVPVANSALASSPGDEFARSCQVVTSAAGRFRFCFAPADEPLIGIAAPSLDAMAIELAQALGGELHGEVRVEVAPTLAIFAERTGLPLAQLTASQTVGIARGNTIFLLSPRVTVAGFRWLDTLGHELVHLHLAARAGARVPVWLQEGLARYFEGLWRAAPGGQLRLAEQLALAEAIERGALPRLETLTSFAALPDVAQSELAYAQALSYVRFFAHGRPARAIREVVDMLAAGASVEAALAGRFDLAPTWRGAWRTQTLQAAARLRARPLSPKADGYVRLAAMLRAAGHLDAAAIELQKALAEAGRPELTVVIALARVALARGEAREAVALLAPVRDRFDDDLRLAPTLGLAAWQAGDVGLARLAMEYALAINPFDPTIRCTLGEIYAATRHPGRAREAAACQMLRPGNP